MQPRNLSRTDGVLLATVSLQALIVVASRYLVQHGLAPSAYIALRFAIAAPLLASVATRAPAGLSISSRGTAMLAAAAIALGFGSQASFAQAIDRTSAATVGVITGSVPLLTALIAATVRVERLAARTAAAATGSLLGVVLVTLGPGSAVGGGTLGCALAFAAAACWAAHSVAVARLTSRWSALGTSALVTIGIGVLLLASSGRTLGAQDYALDWTVWAVLLAVGGATAGVNLLWYAALGKVGASRAALYANLQPCFVVLLSVVLLGERVTRWTLLGGALITTCLVAARRPRPGDRLTAATAD